MNTTNRTAVETMSPALMSIAKSLEVKEGADFEKRVRGRMVAIGITSTCNRCCGSGHYSYNRYDGTRCFGCNGRGQVCAKIDAKAVEAAAELATSGKVAEYLAHRKLIADAKRAIRPLMAEIKATIAPIGEAYTKAGKAFASAGELLESKFYEWQVRATDTYYGSMSGPVRTASACDVESSLQYQPLDPEWGMLFAVEILKERLAEAKAVVAEFELYRAVLS